MSVACNGVRMRLVVDERGKISVICYGSCRGDTSFVRRDLPGRSG